MSTEQVGGRSEGKLMWLVGDGQIFEHDDWEDAKDWALYSDSDGPTLVRVAPADPHQGGDRE